MEKTKGQIGVHRRACGVWLIFLLGTCAFLDGFNFFTFNVTIAWTLAATGMGLLISGIAKDLMSIAKGKR